MALKPSDRYPGQTDIEMSYPYGKARNAGSYQDGTGTPLEKDWVNDDWGFKQALLAAASITPSGDPDSVTASQYLDAVKGVIAAENVPLSTEVARLAAFRDEPSTYAEVFDDFMPGAYDQSTGLLHTNLTWRVTAGQTATQGPVTQYVNNPGVHFATLSAGESYELHLGEEIIPGLMKWGFFERATIVFAVHSTNFTGAEAFVGLASKFSGVADLGSDVIGLGFKGSSANWFLRRRVASVNSDLSGPTPVVASNFVVMKLQRRLGTHLVDVWLNGTLITTMVDGTTGPSDLTGLLNVGMVATAGPSASLNVRWDLIHVRWLLPGGRQS